MWPSSGSYMRLGKSTHTERCFSRKSSGMCGQGIRWNQVNFIGSLLARLDRQRSFFSSPVLRGRPGGGKPHRRYLKDKDHDLKLSDSTVGARAPPPPPPPH